LAFQGGFVATKVAIQVADNTPGEKNISWEPLCYVYPEDVNRKQTFEITTQGSVKLADTTTDGVHGETSLPPITSMKLVFEQSSDFFGRVTLYDLDVQGVSQTP
jgi:hypothetical protein